MAILGPFPGGPGVLFEPGEGFTPPLGLGLLSSIDLFSCCCLDIHCGDTVDRDLLACPRILRKYKKNENISEICLLRQKLFCTYPKWLKSPPFHICTLPVCLYPINAKTAEPKIML